MSAEQPRELDDPKGSNQTQQIQTLNTARRELSRIRLQAIERALAGTPHSAYTAYKEAIVNYAMLLSGPLQTEEFATDLWDSRTLAEISIDPPAVEGDVISVKPDRQTIEINGLKDLIESSETFQAPFEFQIHKPHEGYTTETRFGTGLLRKQQLDRIVLELDKYRQEIGLGLSAPDEIDRRSDEPF